MHCWRGFFLLLPVFIGEQLLSFLDSSGEIFGVVMNYCGMGSPAMLTILAALLQIRLSGALILGWGGLPARGIMSMTELVGRFGTEALAGYGIGSRLEF